MESYYDIFTLNANFPIKLQLCYYSTLFKFSEINDNDQINKLLFCYSDIENIKKMNEGKITKFFYFNRECVHKILYDSDEIIHFNYEEINKNLSFYFYLILLINDKPNTLNYTYDSKYIKEINVQQGQNEDENDEKVLYKKIITSKIIIELAKDYKTSNDCFDDENEKILDDIVDNNKTIIEQNMHIFKEIDINLKLEEIPSISIDLIYIEIIISLIKERKFEDYEYSYNIINQLDLENIDITKPMFDKLYEILNNNEDYINDYIISNEEDFSKQKKINFYYILLRYILKYSIYIYQISFLLKTRDNIKNILKKSKNVNLKVENDKEKIKERVNYIIEIFANTKDFSINISKKKKKSNLKSIILKQFDKKNENNKTLDFSISKKYSNESILSDLNSSKELYTLDDVSELHILKYIKKLLSEKEIRNIMKKSIVDLNYYFDINQILKLLNVAKKDEEKFKEIITNDKWKNMFKEDKEKIEFKKIVNSAFYFEEPNEELNKVKQNIPQEVNSNSIQMFKDWIKSEKDMKSN